MARVYHHLTGECIGVAIDRPADTEPKPGTCAACVSFDPMPRGVRDRHLDGWCMNKVACLGAVLATASGSTCKHFRQAT